jgi:hypothetical protein
MNSLSDRAAADLRRARFWSALAAYVVMGQSVLLGLLGLRFGPNGKQLFWGFLVPAVLGLLALRYSRNLRRFIRGERPALASAFRALRVFWMLTALAFALLLADELSTIGR